MRVPDPSTIVRGTSAVCDRLSRPLGERGGRAEAAGPCGERRDVRTIASNASKHCEQSSRLGLDLGPFCFIQFFIQVASEVFLGRTHFTISPGACTAPFSTVASISDRIILTTRCLYTGTAPSFIPSC